MSVERAVRRYQRFQVPVLILGAPGTGKSTLARSLHTGAGPFVAVNAALLGELLPAELFGTVAGAFTGAVDRPGRIAQADGGTLFLDEAGELTAHQQGQILKWLDDGTYSRLGEERVRRSSARLVLATWRDPAAWMRLDLRDRLGHHVVVLPPPSRTDLCAAVADALRRWPVDHAAPALRLDDDARDVLTAGGGSYRSVLTRLQVAWMEAVEEGAPTIALRHLPPAADTDLRRLAERARIEAALGATGGNVREAARRMGVSRATVYRWMHAGHGPAGTGPGSGPGLLPAEPRATSTDGELRSLVVGDSGSRSDRPPLP